MRVTEMLRATKDSDRMLRNNPWFRTAYDAVESIERDGGDPLPMLCEALSVVCRACDTAVSAATDALRLAPPPILLVPPVPR